MKCKFCNKKLKNIFLDLGKMPLANSNLKKTEIINEIKYELKIYVCNICWLVQTKDVINEKEVFNENYSYFSSMSSSWLDHAKKYVDHIVNFLKLNKKSYIVEIASNDGYLLKNFKVKNLNCLGIEPSKSTALVARNNKIKTINEFFTYNLAKKISKNKKADLIIGNNVFAHIPDIHDFTKGLKTILSREGTITLEFQHLLNIMKKNQFDTIYHEHYYYYSVTSLKKIFKYYDLKIYKIEKLSTHGGSLRVYVSHIKNNIKVHSSVKNIHMEEINYGIAKLKTYKDFEVKINNIKKKFNKFIINANKDKKNIFAYGAPAKGNTFLNFCNIKKTDVIGTFDKSPLKINKFLPGTHIKIFAPNMMKKFKIDILIILPWNIKKEVIDMVKKNSTSKKIKFVTAIPSLKIFN